MKVLHKAKQLLQGLVLPGFDIKSHALVSKGFWFFLGPFKESRFLPEPRPTTVSAALGSSKLMRRFAIGLALVMTSVFAALQGVANPAITGSNSLEDFSLQTYSAGLLSPGGQANPASGSGWAHLGSGAGISPTGTNNYSVQFWIKPAVASINPSNCNNKVAVSIELKFAVSLRCGKWEYWIGNRSSWTHTNVDSGIRARAEWTHIQLDFISNFVDFYVNGVKVHNTINNRNSGSGDGFGLTLGAWWSDNNGSFSGEIDELKIWSESRTTNVTNDMHIRGDTSNVNLVAYWDFNEPSGTTIYDRKSSRNLTAMRDSSLRLDVKQVRALANGRTVVTFPRTYLPGVGGWTVPSDVSLIGLLAVGPGGGGGGDGGSGGGGGELRQNSN